MRSPPTIRLGDDVGRLLGAGKKIVRAIARIDRLDEQSDVPLGGGIGRVSEILDHGLLGRGTLLGWDFAGEAVNLTAADRGDVVKRLLEQRSEFLLVTGNSGNA